MGSLFPPWFGFKETEWEMVQGKRTFGVPCDGGISTKGHELESGIFWGDGYK